MKLTPLDIRKHDFSKKLRGYDPDEVHPFLEMMSQQWEELQDEVRHAQDRVREMENKISHYEKVEVALQEALEAAKSSAHRTQSHAEERARLLVEEAELKAEQILREADQERFRLRQDVSKLTHRHAEVTARLRHFLMSELEILAQHEEERPIGFMKLIPSRDADANVTPLPAAEESRAAEGTSERAADQRPSDQRPSEQRSSEQRPSNAPRFSSFGPSSEAEPEADSRRDTKKATPGEEASSTTYADLYARASRRAREQEASRPSEPETVESPEDEEPAWTLRSLVSEREDEGEDADAAGSSAEKDRIRRILEDLD